MSLPQRDATADALKALGIVLVVLGHAPGTPATLVEVIYSVHMPLFFAVAGYLREVQPFERRPLGVVVATGLRSLMVPYLFFFAVSLAYWLATRHLGARAAKFADVTVADALLGLVTGRSVDLFVNPALWFFPCLMLCQLVATVLRQWLSPTALFAGAVLVATLMLMVRDAWPAPLPMGLDIAFIALPFFAAGHWVRAASRSASLPAIGHTTGLLLAALAGALWLALTAWQGRVDLALASFGRTPWLYLPTALAGLLMLTLLLRNARPHPMVRWLADNSLVIFPMHLLLINFASGAVKGLMGAAQPATYGPLWCVPFVAFGLLACWPVARILTRHAPGLLGRSTPSYRPLATS